MTMDDQTISQIQFALDRVHCSRTDADEAISDLRLLSDSPVAMGIADRIAAVIGVGRFPTRDSLTAMVEQAGGDRSLLAPPADFIAAAKALGSLRLAARNAQRKRHVDGVLAELSAGRHADDPIAYLRREMETYANADLVGLDRDQEADLAACVARSDALFRGDGGVKLVEPFVDARLGRWAHMWASPSGLLLPSASVIMLAAQSGAGKTALANAMAACAITGGIPCLYYQAELAPESHLGDITKLVTSSRRSGRMVGAARTRPDVVRDFFRHPSNSTADICSWRRVRAELDAWLRRNRGVSRDPMCNGIVVVDYVQMLTDDTSKSPDLMTMAIVSRLTLWAKTNNVVMVILSNMSRGSQRDFGGAMAKALADKKPNSRAKKIAIAIAEFGRNGMAGADIMRAADTAFCIAKVEQQLLISNLKRRENAWDEAADDNQMHLVRIDPKGAWKSSDESLAEFFGYLATAPTEPDGGEPAPRSAAVPRPSNEAEMVGATASASPFTADV